MISLESKAISNLRFPLMLGVVLIHCLVIEPLVARSQGLEISSVVIQLCSISLTRSCVPLFFMISGYLFFLKFGQHFKVRDYYCQLSKRTRTLLVPYLFWNLLVLGYFAFMHKFTPSLINSEFNNVYQYTWLEWLRSFWDNPGGKPICYQFWFLRDLMVVVLCSPIVYLLAKYGKYVTLGVLLVAWLLVPEPYPYQTGFTFFTMGAIFSIHRWSFAEWSRRTARYMLPVWCVLLIVNIIKIGGGEMVEPLLTLTSMPVYIAWAISVTPRNQRLTDFLGASSFFIYAFHGFPVTVLIKVVSSLFQSPGDMTWLFIYFVCFVGILMTSLLLYWALLKTFPKLTSVIMGCR